MANQFNVVKYAIFGFKHLKFGHTNLRKYYFYLRNFEFENEKKIKKRR